MNHYMVLTERDDSQIEGVCDTTLCPITHHSPAFVGRLMSVEIDFVYDQLSIFRCSHLTHNGGHCTSGVRLVLALRAIKPKGDVVVVATVVQVPVDCHIFS